VGRSHGSVEVGWCWCVGGWRLLQLLQKLLLLLLLLLLHLHEFVHSFAEAWTTFTLVITTPLATITVPAASAWRTAVVVLQLLLLLLLLALAIERVIQQMGHGLLPSHPEKVVVATWKHPVRRSSERRPELSRF